MELHATARGMVAIFETANGQPKTVRPANGKTFTWAEIEALDATYSVNEMGCEPEPVAE